MFNKIIKNIKGLSLIEMIIGMAIIGIISTISMANFNAFRRSSELNMAAHRLASDIRKMQSYALSLKEHDFGSGPEIPQGGWGIYLDYFNEAKSKKYILFADEESASVPGHGRYDSASERFENDIHFTGNVYISKIDVDISDVMTKKNNFYLTYRPPDPETLFCFDNNSCRNRDNSNRAIITLFNGVNTKTIKVNKFGLVDVD